MSATVHRFAQLSSLVILVLAVSLSSCASNSSTTDSQLGRIKARVEGVYSLDEWQLSAEVARPPRVDGRFMLLNGAVVTLLHNRQSEANQTTVASYGSYSLDAGRFAYRYDDTSVYVQTASGITVSRKLPWEGMRGFAVVAEGNTVRFRSDSGNQEFLFTPDGLTYSENGKVQRVWKRMVEKQ